METIDISKTKCNAKLKGLKAKEHAQMHFIRETAVVKKQQKKGCINYNNLPENWLLKNDNE